MLKVTAAWETETDFTNHPSWWSSSTRNENTLHDITFSLLKFNKTRIIIYQNNNNINKINITYLHVCDSYEVIKWNMILWFIARKVRSILGSNPDQIKGRFEREIVLSEVYWPTALNIQTFTTSKSFMESKAKYFLILLDLFQEILFIFKINTPLI